MNIQEALKTAEIRTIKQSELTCSCWSIQFRGLEACEECEFKDTPECGGQNILEMLRKTNKLQNEKGYSLPLGKRIQ